MSRSAFFRQTGWMLVATGVSGAFMFLVNPVLTKPLAAFLKSRISPEEFGLYGALVSVVSILNTWSGGLESTIIHQTSSSDTPYHERHLRGTAQMLFHVLRDDCI